MEEGRAIGQRDKQIEETRQRILAAAVDLFERHGFTATTVDQIAGAAGVSRRTFFYHFPTKEDAVLVDHDEQLEFLVASIDAQPQDVDAWTALWSALDELAARFDRTDAVRLRHRLVVGEPAVHARSLHLQSTWDTTIAEALTVRIDSDDAAQEAAVLAAAGLACLRSCARSCVTDRDGTSLRAALRDARRVLAAAARLDGSATAGPTLC